MKNGFLKVEARALPIRVADTAYNAAQIAAAVRAADESGTDILCLQELGVTGYTCGDLFLQETLLRGAQDALASILEETRGTRPLCFVGLPLAFFGKLYNCAAAFRGGELLGIVPKTCIPNYSEFYEMRHFTPAMAQTVTVTLLGRSVPFGTDLLFAPRQMPDAVVACEICEDLWVPAPPSTRHAMAGATVIVNLSASNEVVGKEAYRLQLVKSQSARLSCAYVYCSAGEGESTTDLVYSGDEIIAENGTVLARTRSLTAAGAVSEIDVSRLVFERRRMNTFPAMPADGYTKIEFSLPLRPTKLTRFVDPAPFVPSDEGARRSRCEEIIAMQAAGLQKRLSHARAKTAVVGLSGGLDSTLALLVTARAFDALGWDRKNIIAVTMPCFGTTARTRSNAEKMAEFMAVSFKTVPIAAAVQQHFRDISLPESDRSVTYENSQARERTQVLMDIANRTGGIVIGTGDLSEMALGWSTYNGDHMSMYAVNCAVPKTLVRHIVAFEASRSGEALRAVLLDILDTPVSPELLPPKDGEISQKTEDLVGPYELHDFFLYQVIRFGFAPEKVFRLALCAHSGHYDRETILKWLKSFYRRFFAMQFKRSCTPDGPKVGTVTLSPRGDWRMPSDACADLWLSEAEALK